MNLSATEYKLLALLGAKERTGREIAKLYREETGKPISYGSLYTVFRRLAEMGYVKVHDDEDEDGRLRFFRITGAGSKALQVGREFYHEMAEFAKA